MTQAEQMILHHQKVIANSISNFIIKHLIIQLGLHIKSKIQEEHSQICRNISICYYQNTTTQILSHQYSNQPFLTSTVVLNTKYQKHASANYNTKMMVPVVNRQNSLKKIIFSNFQQKNDKIQKKTHKYFEISKLASEDQQNNTKCIALGPFTNQYDEKMEEIRRLKDKRESIDKKLSQALFYSIEPKLLNSSVKVNYSDIFINLPDGKRKKNSQQNCNNIPKNLIEDINIPQLNKNQIYNIGNDQSCNSIYQPLYSRQMLNQSLKLTPQLFRRKRTTKQKKIRCLKTLVKNNIEFVEKNQIKNIIKKEFKPTVLTQRISETKYTARVYTIRRQGNKLRDSNKIHGFQDSNKSNDHNNQKNLYMPILKSHDYLKKRRKE